MIDTPFPVAPTGLIESKGDERRLRNEFAGLAMQAIISKLELGQVYATLEPSRLLFHETINAVATGAFGYADAMVAKSKCTGSIAASAPADSDSQALIRLKNDEINRLIRTIQTLSGVLQRIGYKPFGKPEATAAEILEQITALAREYADLPIPSRTDGGAS